MKSTSILRYRAPGLLFNRTHAAFLAFLLALWTTAILVARGGEPAEQIKIAAEVDRTAVPLNRTVRLKVTASWEGALDRFEVEPPPTPELSNLEVVGSASSNWVGEEDGVPTAVKTYEYTLRPKELGMAYIEPVQLRYTEKGDSLAHTLETGRLAVEVVEPVAERRSRSMWMWLPVPVVLLLTGAGLWIWRRRLRAAREAVVEEEQPIEERFLEELKNDIQTGAPDLQNDFAKLSRLLRRYLGERYELPTLGVSSNELINSLQATSLGGAQLERVQEVLSICDLAKFSGGGSSEADLLRAYTLVETLLQEHREARSQAAAQGSEPVTSAP